MKVGKSMRELREGNELKTFFDPRLIKAIGHPVRAHILAVLNERIASGREIGEELGADVSSFYHHIELLEELDCIERVESRPRRGAKEHFFHAKQSVFLDDEAWREIPESLKNDVAATALQRLLDDAMLSLKAGSFNARDDRHASWTPASFDLQGWEETRDLMGQTLSRLGAIQKAAALRLARGATPQIKATVGILTFETAGDA